MKCPVKWMVSEKSLFQMNINLYAVVLRNPLQNAPIEMDTIM